MAFSYLTQGQKDTIGQILDNVHETFSIDVTLFKIGQQTLISNNSGYNAIYGSGPSSSLIEESKTIKARVRYVKMEEEFFDYKDGSSNTSVSNRIILPAGSVRMKVTEEDHLYAKDSKRAEINGRRFILKSNPRPAGMFDKVQFWEYFLIPLDA